MNGRAHRLEIVAALTALALGACASFALAGSGFRDPVGDVTGGTGPDLVAVTVSHTASTVTFRFRFAKAPPLGQSARDGWVDVLILGIDVPPRSLTRTAHGWTGLDYDAGLHGTQTTALVVKTPKTTRGRGTVVSRPKAVVAGSTVGFTVARSRLGDPAWMELVVAAGREGSGTANGSDAAPNRGVFHYRLRRAG